MFYSIDERANALFYGSIQETEFTLNLFQHRTKVGIEGSRCPVPFLDCPLNLRGKDIILQNKTPPDFSPGGASCIIKSGHWDAPPGY
jgi:hypothetical protein